ncbi:hypothetical protein FQN50_008813 [Emmonsiellopsis sp. PD_5]|nr:hypothetical protein FQN50_008813 [Emmonsiellopsis sp. PD_5]
MWDVVMTDSQADTAEEEEEDTSTPNSEAETEFKGFYKESPSPEAQVKPADNTKCGRKPTAGTGIKL